MQLPRPIVREAPQASLSPLVTTMGLSSMNLSKPSNLFLDSAFVTFYLYLKALFYVSSGWLVKNKKKQALLKEKLRKFQLNLTCATHSTALGQTFALPDSL